MNFGAEKQLRALVADISNRLHRKGWVANHDGNVSVRLDQARFLATPTAFSKGAVEPDDVLVLDVGGAVLGGKHRVFSEWNLHATCYGARSGVTAVVHAHPPMATGFSVSGAKFLETPFMAEPVVSLGAGIPTAPFAAPGPAACAALPGLLAEHDAMLLANHGVLAVGADLEQAYLRMELVEHLANIAYFAHHTGGIRPLPASAIGPLLEARRKAGLGSAGRSGASAASDPGQGTTGPAATAPMSRHLPATSPTREVVACAPAPPGATVRVVDERRPRSANLPRPEELASIIRDELARALKQK